MKKKKTLTRQTHAHKQTYRDDWSGIIGHTGYEFIGNEEER